MNSKRNVHRDFLFFDYIGLYRTERPPVKHNQAKSRSPGSNNIFFDTFGLIVYSQICWRTYRIWRIASSANASEQSQILYVLYHGNLIHWNRRKVETHIWAVKRFHNSWFLVNQKWVRIKSVSHTCVVLAFPIVTNISVFPQGTVDGKGSEAIPMEESNTNLVEEEKPPSGFINEVCKPNIFWTFVVDRTQNVSMEEKTNRPFLDLTPEVDLSSYRRPQRASLEMESLFSLSEWLLISFFNVNCR